MDGRALEAKAPEQMLTAAQVAGRLAVGVRTLQRLVAAGKFPEPVRYNRRLMRWKASDVDAHLASLGEAPR